MSSLWQHCGRRPTQFLTMFAGSWQNEDVRMVCDEAVRTSIRTHQRTLNGIIIAKQKKKELIPSNVWSLYLTNRQRKLSNSELPFHSYTHREVILYHSVHTLCHQYESQWSLCIHHPWKIWSANFPPKDEMFFYSINVNKTTDVKTH